MLWVQKTILLPDEMPKFDDKLQLALDYSVMGAIGRSGDCGKVGNIGPLKIATAA